MENKSGYLNDERLRVVGRADGGRAGDLIVSGCLVRSMPRFLSIIRNRSKTIDAT